MMDFKKFVNEVAEGLKKELPEYKICTEEICKANLTTLAITVEKGTVGLNVYLEKNYDEFLEGSTSLETAVAQLKQCIFTTPIPDSAKAIVSNVSDYNWVKNRLCLAIFPIHGNEEFLSGVPYKKICDLALTYKIYIEGSNDSEVMTIQVKNEFLETWGISEDELHKDALINSPKVNPVSERDFTEFTILQGKLSYRGNAAALWYPGVMEQYAEKFGGSYFVIPSSIYEVLLRPDDGLMTPEDLNMMVSEVNSKEVAPDEVLSNHAYYYDMAAKEFKTL